MADKADRKPFVSDDDLPADDPGGIDPLLELSQIAGFGPDDRAEPDERQIDLEDALLAELTPQEAPEPADDVEPEPVEPADLPPFIGAAGDPDAAAPVTDDMTAPAMEAELSPPLPDTAPAVDAWPPHGIGSAEPDEAAEPIEDIPAFLAPPASDQEAASATSAAPSLEDELAAMLAGDAGPSPAPVDDEPSPGEPAAAFDEAAPVSQGPILAPADENPVEQDVSAMAGIDDTPAADAAPDAVSAPEPADPAPADDIAPEAAAAPAPIWDTPEDEAADHAEPEMAAPVWTDGNDAGLVPEPAETADLDEDFAAAFDEELSIDNGGTGFDDPFAAPVSGEETPAVDLPAEPQPRDPVDELAAIMGYEPPVDPVEPDVMSADAADDVERTLDDMDADFQSALDADLSGAFSLEDEGDALPPVTTVTASAANAPVVDTVDMSPFEGVPASDFDVPEFDRGDATPGAEPSDPNTAFADGFDHDAQLAGHSGEQAHDGASGAATATALAGAFDSAQFEAELARDMEFVNHDLNAERNADGLELDTAGESAAPAERSGRRGMMIGLAVAGLAIAGVVGVLAFSGGEGAVDDGPVLVEADDTPVKIEPDDPGGTTVPNQDRAVFADGDTATPAQQNLVSTAEEPVDIAAAPADSLPSAVAAGEKAEDRLTEGGTEGATSTSGTPITPRRVRTLIVRPDGTLEERAAAPVETTAPETVAAAPATTAPASTETATPQTAPVVQAPQTVAGVPVTEAAEPTAPANGAIPPVPTANTTPADASNTAQAGTTEDTAPVVVRRVQTRTATPPLIRDRPSDQPVNVVNGQQVAAAPAAAPVASPAPAPTPQAAAPAQQAAVPVTSGSTGFSVQLAALPSEAAARATATRLSQQYGNLIGGRGLTIQRAVIDGRGTFYRVRVAANGSGDANALCNSIKAAGGNCFVAR